MGESCFNVKLRYLAGLPRHKNFGNSQFSHVTDRTTYHRLLMQTYEFAMHFRMLRCDVTDYASV